MSHSLTVGQAAAASTDRAERSDAPVCKSSVLQRLYLDWRERCRGTSLPARADFDPVELRYIMGSLSLIDVLYHPRRFRYRLHATKIVDRVGVDLTGEEIAALPNSRFRHLALTHFVEVVEQRRPVVRYREREFVDNGVWNCEVLVLPLAGDGQTVDMLMSALIWY